MSVTHFQRSVMSPPVYTDEINKLPDEIIMEIFKYLPPCSIDACELVCQRWGKLASDPSVWRDIVFVYSGRPQVQKEHAYNMKIIETQSEKVHCLKVQYIEKFHHVYRIISMCRNITSLELTMCTIDQQFEMITELKKLRKLCLKNSILRRSDASDVTVQFDTLKYLNYLELSEFGLNSNNCDSLMRCKYLSNIKIRKVKGLTLEYIKKLIDCKKEILKTFQVYGDDAIDNKCLQLLSECPVLEDLAIVRCERLTDEGFAHLATFKNLLYLQIWNNANFTERCLTETLESDNLVKLIRLSFSKIANVSPSTVDVISEKYTRLKFLALYQCPKIVGVDYEKQLTVKFRNISVVLY